MKILKIRFENINSLEGKWEIDFSHHAYIENPIFAITGPTGSGKTTLLDCICLALYGRTPRLKTISKSVNELLTRQKGYCSSELTFSTNMGTYRCHWSHHRARKSANGELQQPRHEIVNHLTGEIIENKIREVSTTVERVTGMSYLQFTRSILLAQGSFATFLQASPDERAPLLEQLTGTEIYSRISQKTYERYEAEEKKVLGIHDRLSALPLYSTDEVQELKQELLTHTQETIEIEKKLSKARNLLKDIETQEKLEKNLLYLRNEKKEIESQILSSAPKREKLENAIKCKPIFPLYTTHRQLLKKKTTTFNELSRLKQEADILHAKIGEYTRKTEEAYKRFKLSSLEVEKGRKTGIEARKLDIEIAQHRKNHLIQEGQILRKSESAEKIQCLIESLRADEEGVEEDLKSVSNYIATNQSDSLIIERLSLIEEKFKQHELLRQNKEQCIKDIELHTNTLHKHQEEKEKFEEALLLDSAAAKVLENKVKEIESEKNQLSHSYPDIQQLLRNISISLINAEKLKLSYSQLEKTMSILQKAEKRKKEVSNHLVELASKKRELTQKVSVCNEFVKKQEEIVLLASKVKNYEEERKNLRSGDPCPLCGSTNHPYGSDTNIHFAFQENKLKKEREQLEEAKTLLLTADSEIIQLKNEVDGLNSSLQDCEKSQRELTTETFELCKKIEMNPDSVSNESIEIAIEQLQKRQSEMNSVSDRFKKLDEQLSDLRGKSAKNSQSVKEKEIAIQEIKTLSQSQKKDIEHDQNSLLNTEEKLQGIKSELAISLLPLGVKFTGNANHSRLLEELQTRRIQWETAQKKQQHLQRYREDITFKKNEKSQQLKKLREEIAIEKTSLRESAKAMKQQVDHRKVLFGDKNPDEEDRKLELQRKKSEELFTTMKTRLGEIRESTVSMKTKIETHETLLQKLSLEIDAAAKDLTHAIDAAGLDSVDSFLSSRLQDDEIDSLSNLISEIENRRSNNATLLNAKELELSTLQKVTADLPERSQLQDELASSQKQIDEHQQQVGRVTAQLEENEKRRAAQKSTQEELTVQKKERDRWQRLNKLIGSANGKKFRNFAQGITFEVMISYANRNLKKMSDRYLLTHDHLKPLELGIIDSYRTGDIRSTQNLSGGESFLVSLSLALGLSNMAGTNVEVDSLFLDEGFGTLDEETLETALQTLASLRQEGKNIGIISHIGLLQDRITTKIVVEPTIGGYSTLKGPGVRCFS